MPNSAAKNRKRKKRLLNLKLKKEGRTAIQVKNYREKHKNDKPGQFSR